MTTLSKDTIAIDFGSTNTYIVRCPEDSIVLQPISFDGSTIGIDTVLLYTNDPPDVSPFIGEQAFNGWGVESAENRKIYNYRFHSHFKPNIEHSKEAQQNAKDFFKAVLRDAQKNNIKMFPLESRVIIGVPSEAGTGFRNSLKMIAKDAGYGDVELIDEPIGAMLDSIASKTFPLSEILAGFLVVDFGGGTCDFAFLRDGQVKHSWGEMFLGGQLFDDLFYRWYCDLYPGKEQELENNGDAFYARTSICRKWKEKFSQHVVNSVNKPFAGLLVEDYGRVSGITWDEFLHRAKNYVPTNSFIKHQDEIGSPLPQQMKDGKTDLLQWFQDSLELGLKKVNIDIQDIHVITFAGGSCQWLFASEYCKNAFKGVPLFKSDNVYAAIARGLAVYPALKHELSQKQEDLKKELPSVYADIHRNVEAVLTKSKQSIVSKILYELFDNKIEPYLIQFRQQGGTIRNLEDTITRELEQFKPRISQLVKEEITNGIATLYNLAFANLGKWLKQHQLQLVVEATDVNADTQVKLSNLEIGADIADTISTFAGRIVGGITALFGLMLTASGPLGWLTGLGLTAAAGMGAAIFGKAKVKETINTISISPLVLGFALTDNKINKARQDTSHSLAQELDKVSQNIINELQSKLENIVNAEIKRLDVANIIR